MLARVADRRRGADERGVRPVEARDAQEAPQHVGHVRAEDAPVRVELVDDDVAQVLQRARPARVVREDARVCSMSGFVRTMPRPLARRAPRVGRRVAVEDDGAARRARRRASARAGPPPDRARAPWWDRGRWRARRDRRRAPARTGRWKQRLLPLAVGVATTTWRARRAPPRTPAPGARRAARCRAPRSACARPGREPAGKGA